MYVTCHVASVTKIKKFIGQTVITSTPAFSNHKFKVLLKKFSVVYVSNDTDDNMVNFDMFSLQSVSLLLEILWGRSTMNSNGGTEN